MRLSISFSVDRVSIVRETPVWESPDIFCLFFKFHLSFMSSDFSYFRLYLKKYLLELHDNRSEDDFFLHSRCEAAEEAFNTSRRSGLSADRSHEIAMSVLLEGL